MLGSAEAHYGGIEAFSETDQTSDLKATKLLPSGTLKTYPGSSHGMLTVNADVLNADRLEFVAS